MGCDSVDPPFDPSITKYVIHRAAGSDFRFKAALNRIPVVQTEENGWNYQPYPGFSFEMQQTGAMYKTFWSPGNWVPVYCPPGETEVSVVCQLKQKLGEDATFWFSMTVITSEMTPEQLLACSHLSTLTSEGECWGGGSGSCTVEIVTRCAACGTRLSTTHDHRD